MYKLLNILIPLLLIFMQSCEHEDKFENTNNDLTENNIFGHVKILEEISYSVEDKFGEIKRIKREREPLAPELIQGLTLPDFRNHYNNKGFITKKENISKTDKVFEFINNDYNGTLITESNKFHLNQEDSIKLSYKHIFEYNNNGSLATKKEYTGFGRLDITTNYVYDGIKLVEENTYYQSGTIKSRITYDYLGSEKNYTKRHFYNDSPTLKNDVIPSSEEKYQNGLLIESKITYYLIKNDYNKDGLKTKSESYLHSGELWTTTEYEYDKYGNLILENIIDRNRIPKEISYNYKYDEMNNWIDRIKFENNVPKYQLLRKIEYY